jgi:hypothetical protein
MAEVFKVIWAIFMKGSMAAFHKIYLAFDTYSPWKLVGGINKGHPDDTDIANAVTFFDDIRNK